LKFWEKKMKILFVGLFCLAFLAQVSTWFWCRVFIRVDRIQQISEVTVKNRLFIVLRAYNQISEPEIDGIFLSCRNLKSFSVLKNPSFELNWIWIFGI
jgi:hypothetical protein